MNLSKHLLYILVIISCCIKPLFAQQSGVSFTLKGKIVDETTGSPLEFATVALKKMRDSSLVSGTITDMKGDFTLESLPPGGYSVEIAFIGYEKYTGKVVFRPQGSAPINDMGNIKLKPSAKLLEGAEIVADKSFAMNNIDRKTYNTDQLAVTTGGNVNDILENLPSVELDADGNVSLRGNENVTILIDGRPSGLTGSGGKSLLESLPASAIEKVEVITNPSAKYDPDGISGIINIITKKNKLTGLTGSIGLNTNFDKGYGGSAALNYRKGKLNMYSNLGYNHNIRFSSTESYRQTFFSGTSPSFLSQQGEGESNNSSFNIKVGADYNVTNSSTLSFSTIYNLGLRKNDEFLWYDFTGDIFEPDSLYRRDTQGKSDDQGFDLELNFKKNFKSPGRILNLQATSSLNMEDNEDNFDQQVFFNESIPNLIYPPDLQHDLYTEENNIYTFTADYEHPISNDKKIEGGFKSTLRHIDNDYYSENFDEGIGAFVGNEELTNRFVYDDGVHAVYAQYRQSIGKFGIQAGLRSEYAERESELINTGENFTKDYFSFFPSAFLSWKPDLKWQFKASYSRRINRPRTGQLNPFANYVDPLNIRTGNPDLDPEYTDSYEVEGNRIFNKINVTATLYYRYTHDPIQRYRFFDAATGISNVSFENINSAENYGLELILNGNLFKWWSFTLSSNMYQNTIDASNIEADLGSSDIAISARIFTTFKLPYQSDLQITYFYRAPFEVPQGSMKDMQMASIALSKKLLKDKLTATLRVSDPFDTQRFGINLDGPGYTQDFIRRRDTRTFTFALNWRFGELRDRDARPRREAAPPREEIDMGM
ncbi:MAG: TonB-dependent receptor [Bacteroidota bacterium]|nr:TonB-dependent receptor [Bacteroidota bacterium]